MTLTRLTRVAKAFFATGAAATLLLTHGAAPVSAHLAIRLDIRAPQPGSHVESAVDVVVFAQPTFAGVSHVAFGAQLDGHFIDPSSGRNVPAETRLDLKVNTEARIPLRDLSPGHHLVVIAYRPDIDAPIVHVNVDFVRNRSGHRNNVVLAVVGFGCVALLALAIGLFSVKRHRART